MVFSIDMPIRYNIIHLETNNISQFALNSLGRCSLVVSLFIYHCRFLKVAKVINCTVRSSDVFWNHANGRVLNDELYSHKLQTLPLTVLVVTIDAQWERMGDVGLARYEPALLPPCLTIRVLSYNNQ